MVRNLIVLVALLVSSCGESETEALSRETREREAAQREARQIELERIQKAKEQMKQGDGFSLDDR